MFDKTIVGIQEGIKGTSKKTGKPYSGMRIFYTYLDRAVNGTGCDNIFINDQYVSMDFIPQIGDQIELMYNQYGNLKSVEVKTNMI